MDKRTHFLPESISVMLRDLCLRALGLLLCLLSLWLVISLFFYNPYLSGFAAHGSFGSQGITGNIVGFIKYVRHYII